MCGCPSNFVMGQHKHRDSLLTTSVRVHFMSTRLCSLRHEPIPILMACRFPFRVCPTVQPNTENRFVECALCFQARLLIDSAYGPRHRRTPSQHVSLGPHSMASVCSGATVLSSVPCRGCAPRTPRCRPSVLFKDLNSKLCVPAILDNEVPEFQTPWVSGRDTAARVVESPLRPGRRLFLRKHIGDVPCARRSPHHVMDGFDEGNGRQEHTPYP